MRIGIALGGGGAKGLAHVALLEVFDELGIRPHRIAGTSIGAVLGAFYAAGTPAREIREELADVLADDGGDEPPGALDRLRGWMRMADVLDTALRSGGLLRAEKFLLHVERHIGVTDFEELEIPLRVVAADFWKREQVVFDSGPLRPALEASMALPVVFAPVVRDGRTLIDGGVVNPVPWDLIADECDRVVAVDVSGARTPTGDGIPGYVEAVFNTIQIMSAAIVNEKARNHPPDLLLKPEIVDVQVLDFPKLRDIYRQARPACDELRRTLEAWLGTQPK